MYVTLRQARASATQCAHAAMARGNCLQSAILLSLNSDNEFPHYNFTNSCTWRVVECGMSVLQSPHLGCESSEVKSTCESRHCEGRPLLSGTFSLFFASSAPPPWEGVQLSTCMIISINLGANFVNRALMICVRNNSTTHTL